MKIEIDRRKVAKVERAKEVKEKAKEQKGRVGSLIPYFVELVYKPKYSDRKSKYRPDTDVEKQEVLDGEEKLHEIPTVEIVTTAVLCLLGLVCPYIYSEYIYGYPQEQFFHHENLTA